MTTIRGASLRVCGRIGLVSALVMGCGEVRTVSTMPAGSPDAVADTAEPDAGTAAPDVGPGMPDVGPASPDANADVPAGGDATGPDTSTECAPTSHICGGVCVSRIAKPHRG